jgi:LemA protein
MRKSWFVAVMVLLTALVATGVVLVPFVVGKYNAIQAKDEVVKTAQAQVLNAYQQRADLVLDIVEKFKAHFIRERQTIHEQQTLAQVVEARARVVNLAMNVDNQQSLQNFQLTQKDFQIALARLMAIVERHPNLKANKQFKELLAQLEGTENRIAEERRRYIEAVQDFNIFIRMFPVTLIASHFGYREKPNFTVENVQRLENAPMVNSGETRTRNRR